MSNTEAFQVGAEVAIAVTVVPKALQAGAEVAILVASEAAFQVGAEVAIAVTVFPRAFQVGAEVAIQGLRSGQLYPRGDRSTRQADGELWPRLGPQA